MRRITALALTLALLLVLTGCGFKSGDEFYALPKASDEFKSLETCLQSVLDAGLEYAAPISGTNARSVQLQDLDGDGEDEAIGFFRDSSGTDSPLKIYFFRKDKSDKYQIAGYISGGGAAINSAVTCQFEGDADSMAELVVSWQVSSGIYALSAYSMSEYDGEYVITEMMPSTTYTRYAIADMNQDGNDELVLITLDTSDTGNSHACYFSADNGLLQEMSSAPISNTLDGVDKVRTSTLSDGTPAIYVTGTTQGDNSGQVVTDVLAVTEGTLSNVTLDSARQASTATTRYSLAPDQDINADGVWEIPLPVEITPADASSGDTFYSVGWYQFDAQGEAALVCHTYYNSTDGWYLELPEEWSGHLQLARSDTTEGLTNERGIVFYYFELGEAPTPFLAIYKNTGNDQENRCELYGRMKLLSTQDATYSIQFLSSDFDGGVTANELFNRFHLITTDWSAS